MVDLGWLVGHAKTSFTHHENAITLKTKSGAKQSFSQLAKDVIPPCRLNPALFNGHLQTMYTAVKEAGPPVHYKRQIFQSTHPIYPGQYAVDFVVPPLDRPNDPSLPDRTTNFTATEFASLPSSDSTPMLICLHGLTGGSHEIYLRQVIAPLTASGWESCVINARGCAMSTITTPELFNSRSTWDVRQLILYLREIFPSRPLYAVGFSLGANILTNYVAEEGEDCVLKAAVACSNPWNLEICHHALKRTYIGAEVYSKTMGNNLLRLFDRHKEQMLKGGKIDEEKVKQCKYLYEFDRVVQAPTWGYPTEGAYYRDAQSVDALSAVRIPFLGINAEDDPISHIEAIPFEEFKQNPYTVLCTTNWGGHLSWFQVGGKRWFATAVAEFLSKMHNDIDLSGARGQDNVIANGIEKSSKEYPVWDPANRRLTLPL
ncbi:medium-chain fatty acid ethyl ester synthase/esterase-like protein 1 [Dendryphion nanum]|uniref:alcohol O-acetyltransferase n=1 Tax=Dendryphion nanum TaxID=256645 RepID=A0A9P9IEB0_9PLEO|nr:medium-chain fatty acid ethyl ester synthase/esterase-like protein 1 [Dendryphion nanum]